MKIQKIVVGDSGRVRAYEVGVDKVTAIELSRRCAGSEVIGEDYLVMKKGRIQKRIHAIEWREGKRYHKVDVTRK